MSFYLKTFIASVIILGALDVVWLGIIMKPFNIEQMGHLARMSGGTIDPLKVPAALTYLVMAGALTYFAAPVIVNGTWLSSLLTGSLLGFFIYGVYDLTNLAVLKDYPLPFVFTDIGWGIVSYGIANTALFFLRDKLV